MGSWVLPSHALPCHPTALPSPAPHPRLALSVSPRPSLVPKRLPFAWAAASCTPTAARRNGTLAVVQAAEGDAVVEVAEALGDEPEEEETDGVSEDEELPRKPIVKLGDIMGILHKRAIEASEKERPVPDLRTGDIVQIKLEVPENRRRVSIYKGIVMSKQNAGIHTTIRIRRIIAGIGVEIVFPVYSPNIKEIKVVKHRKVRRARLYYLRDKLPRLSTFN